MNGWKSAQENLRYSIYRKTEFGVFKRSCYYPIFGIGNFMIDSVSKYYQIGINLGLLECHILKCVEMCSKAAVPQLVKIISNHKFSSDHG